MNCYFPRDLHFVANLRSSKETLTKHENDGTTDSKEYQQAMDVFYAKHVCRLDPMPQDVQDTFEALAQDPTVYYTMCVGHASFKSIVLSA